MFSSFLSWCARRDGVRITDENWKPELGELCVSQEFADKVGLDLYDIKDFLVRAYLGGEVKPDPVYGPSLQKDRIEWVDLQPNPYWAERLPRAYYECLNLYLATEMQTEVFALWTHFWVHFIIFDKLSKKQIVRKVH